MREVYDRILYDKFKKFQKISVFAIFISAICFVFMGNLILTVVVFACNAIAETKFYRCPHCNITIDPRKRISIDSKCRGCDKEIFKLN